MEVAASGMAVASLALQLVDSIRKIKTFIRNVKFAPKEIERLIDLLERLEAIFAGVRDNMQEQTSLQGHHFAAPPTTIFRCLQSSEKTVQELYDTIEKFRALKPQRHPNMAKLKSGVAVAFKTKDIEMWEERIEREIILLNTTLGINSNAISTSILHHILHLEQTILTIHSKPPSVIDSQLPVSNTCLDSIDSPEANSTQLSIRSKVVQVPSSLRRFGMYRQKRTKVMRNASSKTWQSNSDSQEEIIAEEDVITLAWRLVGYGLTWTSHRSCNRIIPGLSVFPVVPKFSENIGNVLKTGTILQVQQMFSTGVIHPFARTPDGLSLLHEAACLARADVCQLLLEHGVKPDHGDYTFSPLQLAVCFAQISSASDLISTFRCLFNNKVLTDDFDSPFWSGIAYREGSQSYVESVQWLWQQSTHVLNGNNLIQFRCFIFRQVCSAFSWRITHGESRLEFPELMFTAGDSERIESGCCRLVEIVFMQVSVARDSYTVGNELLGWLARSGVNVEVCIGNELAHLSGKFIDDMLLHNMRVRFESHGDGEWILGFEWEFDPKEVGYLVISEYLALGIEKYRNEWPFHRPYYSSKGWEGIERLENKRFKRRMATKARKERARTGQKQPRSRMPGTWVW